MNNIVHSVLPSIDYETHIGEIIHRPEGSALKITIKDEVIIPLLGERVPSNGLFLGEHIVKRHLTLKQVLELGAGKYAPASFCLLASDPTIMVDAVEVQRSECQLLRETVVMNNLGERMTVIEGDLFAQIDIHKRYDLIFTNMAQLPLPGGAPESPHDHGGRDGWALLDLIITQAPSHLDEGGYLAMMTFDFLGIASRTADTIPSLNERLETSGFTVLEQCEYLKILRRGGETHASLKHILEIYPKASFFNKDKEKVDPQISLEQGGVVFLNFVFTLASLKNNSMAPDEL